LPRTDRTNAAPSSVVPRTACRTSRTPVARRAGGTARPHVVADGTVTADRPREAGCTRIASGTARTRTAVGPYLRAGNARHSFAAPRSIVPCRTGRTAGRSEPAVAGRTHTPTRAGSTMRAYPRTGRAIGPTIKRVIIGGTRGAVNGDGDVSSLASSTSGAVWTGNAA
jgi:hypothetical protein